MEGAKGKMPFPPDTVAVGERGKTERRARGWVPLFTSNRDDAWRRLPDGGWTTMGAALVAARWSEGEGGRGGRVARRNRGWHEGIEG
jgi:hypothetical protein